MRIRPLRFAAVSLHSLAPPAVRWLGNDFPPTLDRARCLFDAGEAVPFLPAQPAVGILEAYWGSAPPTALFIAASTELSVEATVAVSREPTCMQIQARPSAAALLQLHPNFRQSLVTALTAQNLAAACVIEARKGDFGEMGLHLRCSDAAHGIWLSAKRLEAYGVVDLLVARLADSLK